MAEGKLKLYGIASSTCTGRVLVTLFEKEVEDFELQVVNVRKGEGKTPEHMALQVSWSSTILSNLSQLLYVLELWNCVLMPCLFQSFNVVVVNGGMLRAMNGKIQPLVTDGPVEFEK